MPGGGNAHERYHLEQDNPDEIDEDRLTLPTNDDVVVRGARAVQLRLGRLRTGRKGLLQATRESWTFDRLGERRSHQYRLIIDPDFVGGGKWVRKKSSTPSARRL